MRLRTSMAYGLDVYEQPPVLVRYAAGRTEPVPMDPAPAEIARACTQGRAPLAVAAHAQEAALLNLDMPVPTVETARKILPSQLDLQLPFPVEQASYVFPRVRTREKGTEAVAIAMRGDDLRRLTLQTAAGFADPTHVDHEALAALEQATLECPDLGNGLRAILIASVHHVTAVLARGDSIIACPSVRITPESDAASATRRLLPLLRAALGADIDTPFPWFLAGSRAGPALRDAWGRPAGTTFHTAREPLYFLARALARRAVGAASMPCNLRTGPFTHAGLQSRAQARVAQARWTVFAAGWILLLGSQLWLYALDQRILATEAAARQAASAFRPSTTEWIARLANAVHARTGRIEMLSIKDGEAQVEWRMSGDPAPVLRALNPILEERGYRRPIPQPAGPGVHRIILRKQEVSTP